MEIIIFMIEKGHMFCLICTKTLLKNVHGFFSRRQLGAVAVGAANGLNRPVKKCSLPASTVDPSPWCRGRKRAAAERLAPRERLAAHGAAGDLN